MRNVWRTALDAFEFGRRAQRLLKPALVLAFAFAVSVSTLATAAGTGTAAAAAAAGHPAVTVLDDRGRSVELPGPALRVVTLSPSLTETVCSLGACDRLVGVDRFSNWPASVRGLPQLGGLEDTPIERIVALKPDLVLAAGSIRAIDRLEALGLRVVALEAKSLRDTQRVIAQVALALGEPAAGDALWQRMRQRLGAAAARVPVGLRGHSVYFEVASVPYAAGEASFVGETLAQLGLRNIVPATMGPFPQLNPEFVVRAQPQLVMASARALAEMPSRPGWSAIAALRDHRSCGFAAAPWDTLVRAGPRLADGAEALADCLAALEPGTR
jgi:iron complex transport system substrate-binding protein